MFPVTETEFAVTWTTFLYWGTVYVSMSHQAETATGSNEEQTTATIDDVAFVNSSKYRKAVLSALMDGPKMPSEIDIPDNENPIAHVSRSLQELREREFVELLVEDDRQKGRYYGMTELGEAVTEHNLFDPV